MRSAFGGAFARQEEGGGRGRGRDGEEQREARADGEKRRLIEREKAGRSPRWHFRSNKIMDGFAKGDPENGGDPGYTGECVLA